MGQSSVKKLLTHSLTHSRITALSRVILFSMFSSFLLSNLVNCYCALRLTAVCLLMTLMRTNCHHHHRHSLTQSV